jgi:excisionase family DNA binding protein
MRETCEYNQTPTALNGRLAFTPSEVAEILGVDRGLVYRMIAAKKFSAIKVGVAYIVPRQSLNDFAIDRFYSAADLSGGGSR